MINNHVGAKRYAVFMIKNNHEEAKGSAVFMIKQPWCKRISCFHDKLPCGCIDQLAVFTVRYMYDYVECEVTDFMELDNNVMFRNKRSQAKGVYYLFLYKQHMDNVYTRVAFHRFPLGSLAVG